MTEQGRVTSSTGRKAWVPRWVLRIKDNGKRLSESDLRVYICLRTFADIEGEAFPLVTTIAGEAELSPRSVERSISHLKALGLLESEQWFRRDGSIGGCNYKMLDVPPEAHRYALEKGERRSRKPKGVPTGVAVPLPTRETGPLPTQQAEQEHRSNNTADMNTATVKSGSTLAALAPDAPVKKKFDPRRGAEDRRLFYDFLGERIHSIGLKDIPYGVTWLEGTLKTTGVYDALRKLPNKNRMKFPGLLLKKISEEMGLESWLIQRGFELIA